MRGWAWGSLLLSPLALVLQLCSLEPQGSAPPRPHSGAAGSSVPCSLWVPRASCPVAVSGRRGNSVSRGGPCAEVDLLCSRSGPWAQPRPRSAQPAPGGLGARVGGLLNSAECARPPALTGRGGKAATQLGPGRKRSLCAMHGAGGRLHPRPASSAPLPQARNRGLGASPGGRRGAPPCSAGFLLPCAPFPGQGLLSSGASPFYFQTIVGKRFPTSGQRRPLGLPLPARICPAQSQLLAPRAGFRPGAPGAPVFPARPPCSGITWADSRATRSGQDCSFPEEIPEHST